MIKLFSLCKTKRISKLCRFLHMQVSSEILRFIFFYLLKITLLMLKMQDELSMDACMLLF